MNYGISLPSVQLIASSLQGVSIICRYGGSAIFV